MNENIKRVYGNNVLAMVEDMKAIVDKDKRTRQAYAIVKVMEILNPAVKNTDEADHKLWDHLFMLADFDLDVDAPYPCPEKAEFETKPEAIPMRDTNLTAPHYGRNIEKIINLLASEPDSEVKNVLIKNCALYLRSQYKTWNNNKDDVNDETIFADMVKLSGGRITIPEGLTLGRMSDDASYTRPGLGDQSGIQRNNNNRMRNKKNGYNKKRR